MRIRKRLIGSICLWLMLVCAVMVTYIHDLKKDLQYTDSKDNLMNINHVTVDGVDYERNLDIDAVLFLGIDKEAVADLDKIPGENGQSDSLNLIIRNKALEEAEILQISRDTMVDVKLYYPNGEFCKKKPAQITLQYAFGDGKHFSCRITAERVSELLYGVEINDYVALTLKGMEHAVNAIGGIPITVPEDYTDIDPILKKGAEIVLDGNLTEKYVRSRDLTDVEGNTKRMQRQAFFLEALFEKVSTIEDEEQLISLYNELEPYMVTNMTIDELVELANCSYNGKITSIEGNIKVVDNHLQFHVDNEKLKKKVLEVFYKKETEIN